MKLACLALVFCLAPSAFAQKLDLKLSELNAMAVNKSEVNLSGKLIRLAIHIAGDSSLDDFVKDLVSIQIRNYIFAKAGSVADKDLEPLRRQVANDPRWSHIIDQKEGSTSNEIWVATSGDTITACLVISLEVRQLHIVHFEGRFTLAQVRDFVDHDGVGGLLSR